MSRTDTWMPLYIGDYLADTMRLTTVQHGSYLLLMMEYWRQGPLPDDQDELAAIAKQTRKAWDREVWPTIRRFFDKQEDGLLHQKRLDRERQKAVELSEKRRLAAQQRGNKKGGANGENSEQGGSNSSAIADQKQDLLDTHAQVAPPSPSHSSLRSENSDAVHRTPIASPEPHREVIAEVVDEPIDARTLLWRQGIPIVRKLTGKPDGACRSLMGRWLNSLRDDCPAMLRVLQDAVSTDPADAVAWISAAVGDRGNRHPQQGRFPARPQSPLAQQYDNLQQRWNA